MTEGTSGAARSTGRSATTGRGPDRRAAAPLSPLSSRERLVVDGVRQVRAGSSVVVLGGPGTGRTYLVSRVVEAVPELRVVSVRSATSTTGLIVSTVHDPSRSVPSGTVRRVSSQAEGADDLTGGEGATVVLADDAHLLDLDHLEMLCDLASDRRIVLVATSDTATTAAPGRDSAVARLTTLWLEGRAGRIDIAGLTDAEGHDLVRDTAGSQRLDLASRHAIVVASGGSPLTIRELTVEALHADGAGPRRDLLGLHGPVRLPPRVLERAAHRLADLTGHERESLVLLSRLDAVAPERAVHYVGDTTLRRLVQHGCVGPVEVGSTTLRATPVDAEAVLWGRSGAGEGVPGGVVARALRSMVDLDAAGLVLEPFECLLLSDSWLDSDDGPRGSTPEVTPEQVSRISTVAARKATAMLQPYRALAHARLAMDDLVSGPAAVEASRALAALGSGRAAHDVLDRVPPAPDAADVVGTRGTADAELVALWRAELDDWDVPAPSGGGVASVESLRRGVHALRAMSWREALDTTQALVDDDSAGLVLRLRACGVAGLAAAFLGLGADLDAVTTTGRRLHATLAAQAGSASAQQVVDEGTAFFSGSAAAHLACSVGWADMPAHLDALVHRSVAAGDVAHTSALSALAGYLALAGGDDMTAEVELGAALDRARRPTSHETHAWTVTMRATALARLGRVREASELCAALEAPGSTVSGWSRYLVESVRHLAEPALLVPAVAPTALALQEVAAQPTIALFAAAEAAGNHDGSVTRQDLVDAATAVRQQTDIGSLQAVADYVIAASTSDAETLADLTRTFEGLGMRHLADACEEQALRLLDPDSPHALSAWRDRADRPEGEATDEPLTAREREVAVLAGRGMSNRDIASRLFLSVRTVESHVYLARRKLGAVTRHDLASRLAGGTTG